MPELVLINEMVSKLRSPAANSDNTEVMHTDICVVGTGPGGAIPAVQLAADGHQVLVFEAGPKTGGVGISHYLDQIDVAGKVDLPLMGVVQLGGSSNLWAGRLAKFEAIDLVERPWIGLPGWPIALSDIPYEKAFRLLSGQSAYPEAMKASPPFDAATSGQERLDIKPFVWAKTPFNTGKYLADAAKRHGGRLRILFDCAALHLTESTNGKRIEFATFKTKDGRLLKVMAKTFILGAGGIETPRILLSSKARHAAGIGNGADMVGRYLSTHPKLNIAKLTLEKPVTSNHPLFGNHQQGALRQRYGLGLSAQAQKQFKLLNHYVQLVPAFEFKATELFQKFRETEVIKSMVTETSTMESIKSLYPAMGKWLFGASEWVPLIQRRARHFRLRAFLDQFPSPLNRVTLSGKRNNRGVETANVTWSLSKQDMDSILAFMKILDQELRRAAIGSINLDTLSAEGVMEKLTSVHSHYMGTTRMARSQKDGVVDRNCKVFGLDNLYISGPSVFPTYGYANPFFTVAALGLRIAAHVQSSRVAPPAPKQMLEAFV